MQNNQIINFSINLSKIDKNKIFAGKKGLYLSVTVAQKKETDRYGNTHAMYISPSKSETERRKQGENIERVYLGDGKIVDFQGIRQFDPQKDDLPF